MNLGWLIRFYLWLTYRLYDELAPLYDHVSWLVSAGRWAGWRARALDHVTGPRVLEVGYGTGSLLIQMTEAGHQVVGLELSSAMELVTTRKLRRHQLCVARVRGRVQDLPFPDGVFQSIVSTFPAPYIVNPNTIRECSRVLCPGGRLIVVGAELVSRSRRVRALWARARRDAGVRVPHWSSMLGREGLRVTVNSQEQGVHVLVAERWQS